MMRKLWRRVCYLARRSQFDAELEEEMRLHRELRPERPFGNVTALRESSREEWSWRWLDELLQNLRYGRRMLARNVGFTFVAAATLALGIGANTAVFSILQAVLLRPLPYEQPDRVVVIYDQLAHRPEHGLMFAPYDDFEAYRKAAQSFSSLAADTWAMGSKVWRQGEHSTALLAVQVTRDFFRTLGVKAQLGRTFDSTDENAGCAVALSDKFWRTRLMADPGALKRPMILGHVPCHVVGIMPPQFEFYPRVTPLWMLAADPAAKRDGFVVGTVARLKPNVTSVQAQAEVTSIHRALRSKEDHEKTFEPQVHGIQDEFTFLAGRTLRATIWLMAGAVFCVLLIACVNVANLWIGKALGREREFAVRTAIGAGRGRVIRQLLTEALLLAAIGTVAGLALAWGMVRVFNLMTPIELPVGAEVAINLPVVLFSCAMTVGTTLLFGLLPAWRTTRIEVNQALKASARSATQSFTKAGTAGWTVALEVALSVVLLVGATSLVLSLQKLNSEPLGFDPHGLAVSGVTLQGPRYESAEGRLRYYQLLRNRLAQNVDFALASNLPPYIGASDKLQIRERKSFSNERVGDTGSVAVSPGYFSTMRTKQLAGRDFKESDEEKAAQVAIVNASLVREYFPKEDPLGRQIRLGMDQQTPWLTIIGVVDDQKHTQLMHEMSWASNPMIYRPLKQEPPIRSEILSRESDTGGRQALLKTIALLDPDVPVSEWDSMEMRLAETMKFARFRAALVSSFAFAAMLLAGIGLHGVLAQLVTQRTPEFGIRMAIGAVPRDVFWLVTKQGGSSIAVGLAGGLLATFVLRQYLASLLYEGHSDGPSVIVLVTSILLIVAALATWLPAWRASRVSPAECLRNE